MDCLRNSIRQALGGSYKLELEQASNPSLNVVKQPSQIRVAVIGSGLAGLVAAIVLLERGYQVTIYEAEEFIGGKCGAWKHDLSDGTQAFVSHGLHGIFPQYYNCIDLFEKVGITQFFKPIGEYLIIRKDGQQVGFRNIETTPVFSLISMWRNGLYKILPVLMAPKCIIWCLEFLKYSPERADTFDNLSFEEFCKRGTVPYDLKLMFTTFARSFFASPDRISMANLLTSFHFYFMSNDGGLLYDYLAHDYQTAFCQPMTKYIESRGGKIKTQSPVKDLKIETNNKIRINESVYDYSVLACDVGGVRNIMDSSTSLQTDCPELVEQLEHVKPSQRYSVIKIWVDKRIENDERYPIFFMFEKCRVMDSMAICHHYEPDSASWCQRHKGGGVYELHCYAVPDDISDSLVVDSFLQDLYEYFPEMGNAKILDQHVLLNKNFTAFHVGLNKNRPKTDTAIPTLKLAGDWVRLPVPAALMEGAVLSGILAANSILGANNMEPETVYCVPPVGLLSCSKMTGCWIRVACSIFVVLFVAVGILLILVTRG